jgi:hypothetical protein
VSEEEKIIKESNDIELNAHIKRCDAALEDLKVQERNLSGNIFAVENFKEELRMELIHRWGPENKDKHIVIGTWECSNSPIGVCFYDDDEDRCHDQCLICGDPDERK